MKDCRKRLLSFFIICFLAVVLSACTEKPDEDLAFIDEREETSPEGSEISDDTEGSKTPLFSKDFNQNVNQDFGFGRDRVYYAVDRTVYEVDMQAGIYQALCKKPGCRHDDDSCHAWLGDSREMEGNFQVYDDGLYQYVFKQDDPENPYLRYYRIDPAGESPKSISFEIPLQDLWFVTNEYQIFPEVLLHQGYAILSATAQNDPEEPYDPQTEEDYDPKNTWNDAARTMVHDFTDYVSAYNLETGEMKPLLQLNVKGHAHTFTQVLPYEDALFLIVSSERVRPAKTADSEGNESYELDFIVNSPCGFALK